MQNNQVHCFPTATENSFSGEGEMHVSAVVHFFDENGSPGKRRITIVKAYCDTLERAKERVAAVRKHNSRNAIEIEIEGKVTFTL